MKNTVKKKECKKQTPP